MDLGLSNKKALVTGASRGLGFAAAHRLALEGAEVVINSRNQEKLEQAAGNIASETGQIIHPLTADLADPSAIDSLVSQAVEKMGRIGSLDYQCRRSPSWNF